MKHYAVMHKTEEIIAEAETLREAIERADATGLWDKAPGSCAPYYYTTLKPAIRVLKWVPYSEADKLPTHFGGCGGFVSPGMRWADFVRVLHVEGRPYAEALRREVVARGLKETGAWHQEARNDGAPVFNDGSASTFSYRAWGDLLAATWAEEENVDYGYFDFYC